MKDIFNRESRFSKGTPSVQLGNLAADLARIQSFSKNPAHAVAVRDLLEESRYFTEWAAEQQSPDGLLLLRRLQRQLTRWMRTLDLFWNLPDARAAFGQEASVWAQRILRQSGLLAKPEISPASKNSQ